MYALRLGSGDHVAEKLELALCVGYALGVVVVGDGKVSVYALDVEVRHIAGPDDVFDALVKVASGAEEAESAHAGVELYVYLQRSAEPSRRFGKLCRLRLAAHRLRKVVAKKLRHILRRSVSEYQNGHSDSAAAQLDRFVKAGYGKVIRTALL